MEDTHRKQAIAEQVIVSAGNILVAAGFDRNEIGGFFRQAADQLAPGTAPTQEVTATLAGAGRTGMEPVHAAFRRCKPAADLQAMIARADAVLPLAGDGARLKSAFDLAMQMAPVIAEAQDALRTLAEKAGLPVFAERAEWMASTGATDLADAAPAICREDFEEAYRGAFAAIGAVFEELVACEDAEAFAFLLAHLAENGVELDRNLRARVESGAALLPG